MSLFELFDATYGPGLYESIPDGIGGTDILHGGTVVDHMSPDGVLHSQGMALNVPNVEGGVDVISNGQVISRTQPNAMGGMDVYDGDMGLERSTIPNAEGGVDIYGTDMNMEGMTMPNVFGCEDYLSLQGNGAEIMSYDDPLLHSHEYRMDPFGFGRKV